MWMASTLLGLSRLSPVWNCAHVGGKAMAWTYEEECTDNGLVGTPTVGLRRSGSGSSWGRGRPLGATAGTGPSNGMAVGGNGPSRGSEGQNVPVPAVMHFWGNLASKNACQDFSSCAIRMIAATSASWDAGRGEKGYLGKQRCLPRLFCAIRMIAATSASWDACKDFLAQSG